MPSLNFAAFCLVLSSARRPPSVSMAAILRDTIPGGSQLGPNSLERPMVAAFIISSVTSSLWFLLKMEFKLARPRLAS